MGGDPPKKLPFKATALRENKASTQSTSSQDGQKKDAEDDCLDLFRHSKKMAPILAAQHERKMMKKKEKEKEKEKEKQKQEQEQEQLEEERRKSIAQGKRPVGDEIFLDEDSSPEDVKSSEPSGRARASAARSDELPLSDEAAVPLVEEDFNSRPPATPPPSKRPRQESAPSSRSSKRHRSDEDVPEYPDHDALSRLSPYLQPSPTKTRAVLPSSAPLITLVDSESEDDIKPILKPSPQRRRTSSINEVIEPTSPSPADQEAQDKEAAEDDEEFAEYIRKAEEQRKRNAALHSSSTRGDAKEDTTYILVTSTIPNTHTACLKYRFDRGIRLVRDTWIALQKKRGIKLPIEKDEDIILTWQRKKVYIFSTLLNLGIRPRGDGKLAVDDIGRKGGGLINGRSKVHFEAWTTELFREMELEEERRQKRQANGFLDEESDEEEQQQAVQVEQVKLKLRLKARDLEEVKLTVLRETTVETLASGFRRQRNIPPDKDIGIYFDGDRLEEYDTMESAGVENLDTLEVHIK